MERRSPIALLTTFFTMLALSIFFNACNRMTGEIEPQNTKSSVAQKDSYARMSAYSCSQFIEPQVSQTQRSRMVSQYGADGGTNFDIAASAAPNLTTAYVNNLGSIVYNYMNQITNAIQNGAGDYANTFCDFCSQTYSSYSLYSSINNYLASIRSNIQSDPALTVTQRDALVNVLSAYDSNFHYISGLIEDNNDCFEDPNWYSSNRAGGAIIKGGGGMVIQSGFLSGLGRTLKKIVNIVATIVVTMAQFAFILAAYGYVIGSFVPMPGAPVTGIAVGAIAGGFVGLLFGIGRCINGDYVCIFSC